ncbi:MAG: alanine--tRNA ligase [Oscillospiraceae bacterium]|nr:alanine--tRNA ligase [Oscillospiraceae bacterium]
MQYTGLNELREMFLSFFESKGHLRLKSFSLIPENDKSLLLINAGMSPLKSYFTGAEEPPRSRVTTCQKCIRTPDIDRVGKTARHGTYFEMLGNFSFGDYFKDDAIAWAWEFLTKVLGIPENLLWPSVYKDDDEAYAIWRDKCGVPEERIVRLGKEDNFWEHGSGPCGPCSEIYFDRGPKYGCGSPDCRPGCDCDRFMEIWNVVFSQFNNDGAGNYTELKQKNIDTGMGLERLACVMQGVDNLFEVDTVRRILDHVCEISGKKYGSAHENDVAIRVITDHIRSSVFLISDGVIPSNEGRGYVLRRIIRRAARFGKLIEIKGRFLYELCDLVINENKRAYPELAEKRDYIKRVLKAEEERFEQTLDGGLIILKSMLDGIGAEKKLSGENAFKLYDTYGFPIDLTKELCRESGIDIDENGFVLLMKEQKERARAARGGAAGWEGTNATFTAGMEKTDFVGYDALKLSYKTRVAAILSDGEPAEAISEGEGAVILEATPFYGESGGQVGDTGTITTPTAKLLVTDTKKTKNGVIIHHVTIEKGVVSVGDEALAAVCTERRDAIRRNHSAVHLLHAALRSVLGTHVEQAGSLVDEHRLRFDFKHFTAMTPDEIEKTENIVNKNILAGLAITTMETDPETAKKHGAMALFGEKYGKVVRMVKMGDVSAELCGGTHLDNTAKAGLFKIVSEAGIAAGIRRIEAVTGENVLRLIAEEKSEIAEAAKILKANSSAELVKRAQSVAAELSEAKKEIEALSVKLAAVSVSAYEAQLSDNGKFALLFADAGNDSTDRMRSSLDMLKDRHSSLVAVLYSVSPEESKIQFVAGCGKDAVKNGAHAGNILKKLSPIVGGGGGGRPDSAASGGKLPEKLPDAKKEFFSILG